MMINNAVIRKFWATVLFNFFILSCVGVFLRYIGHSGDNRFNYVHILQAHSHFAFAAVLFLGVICALTHAFIPFSASVYSTFSLIFWLTTVESYAMLYSFSRFGYNYVSIILSTVYLLTTYCFAYFFYCHTRYLPKENHLITAYFALFFLILSSLGVWCMGPLMMKGFAGKPIYFNTVYYYLHFQYNGWFSFAVFAVFIRYFQVHFISKKIIYYFAFATLLLYFLSILWSKPHIIFYILSCIGAIIQLYCFYLISKEIKYTSLSLTLLVILVSFFIKFLLQILSSIPFFAEFAAQNRNLIIAYLHLIFIGTLFLPIYQYFQKYVLLPDLRHPVSLYLFLAAYFITECVLAYTPFVQNYLYIKAVLLYSSIIFPFAITGMFIQNFTLSNKKN